MRVVMENTKKTSRYVAIATCIFNLVFWAGAIVITHFLVFKPMFETIDYKITNTQEVFKVYSLASKGDQKALDRLEQLSHKDVSSAYVMLGMIYREDALQKAGIDLKDPNASFDSVDLSKSNAVILRAVEELRDLELLNVLRDSEALFNDADRDRIINNIKDAEISAGLKNRAKFSAYSTFDRATKDQLSACKLKLEEKFTNEWTFIINFHSFGSCTNNPPDGSLKRMIDIQKGRYFNNQDEKAE